MSHLLQDENKKTRRSPCETKRALLRGEFAISGLTRRALRAVLPDKTPGQLTRLLKRLRVHGLLKKVRRRYTYYLTTLGRQVAALVLRVRVN